MDAGGTGIRPPDRPRHEGRRLDAGGTGIQEPRLVDGLVRASPLPRRLTTVARLWLVGPIAGCVLALAPPTASSQGQATPSARELWEAYPLDPEAPGDQGRERESEASPPSGASPQATPTAIGSPTRPAPEAAEGDDSPAPLLGLGAAVAVVFTAWLWTRRRRAPDTDGRNPVRAASPKAPAPPPAVPRHQTPPRSPSPPPASPRSPSPPPAPWQPPDAGRAWRAQVEWHHADDASSFRVVARTPEGQDETVIGESRPLEWPPASEEAARALTRAADALAASLVRAGWRQIDPGEQLHAKRFAWEPVGSRHGEPADRRPSDRFGRDSHPEAQGGNDVGSERARVGEPPSMAAGRQLRNGRESR
jgi:hypothetical protein